MSHTSLNASQKITQTRQYILILLILTATSFALMAMGLAANVHWMYSLGVAITFTSTIYASALPLLSTNLLSSAWNEELHGKANNNSTTFNIMPWALGGYALVAYPAIISLGLHWLATATPEVQGFWIYALSLALATLPFTGPLALTSTTILMTSNVKAQKAIRVWRSRGWRVLDDPQAVTLEEMIAR